MEQIILHDMDQITLLNVAVVVNEIKYTTDLHTVGINKWLVLCLKRKEKMQKSKSPWDSCLPRL